MSVTNPATSALRDARLPELATLLGAGVPEPLEAAMGAGGVSVAAAEAVQVTYSPGRSVTVRYKTELIGDGIQGEHQLVAVGGKVPDGVAVVENGLRRIGVWRVPHDPFLPGLAAAMDPLEAAGLMARLGVPNEQWRTRLVAYRPGRRAVVQIAATGAWSGGGSVYLKLLPPDQIERLHEQHRRIALVLPIPESLGVSRAHGLVALRTLPGITLRQALIKGAAVPAPEDVLALPAVLPVPDGLVAAPSPLERAPGVARILSFLLPERSRQITGILDDIGQETRDAGVPVHGDFYESQVMVDGGRVVGMLDIDTFGWGRPGDDPATLLGHLAVLGQAMPGAAMRSFASRLLSLCDRSLDPIDLRLRVAAVVLGLATGPFRVQRPDWPHMTGARLDLASRWCASAARVAGRREVEPAHSGNKRNLMTLSGPSHVETSGF
ncbi:MAG TPA: phosphotransferase [Acidimicrobiia bacterium]|nr:phosphotransferase [Acidimicrobiia bacterium]